MLIKQILNFPDMVKEAAETGAINIIPTYLYRLAADTNHYYESVRVLGDKARAVLVETIAEVLKRGLYLLGIKTLERV